MSEAPRIRDLRIVGRERGLRIVRVEMEQRAMPCQMHGKSGAFDPCRFGRGKECETFTGAPLHLHHMGDDVNGARMPGVEGKRATRHLFGTTILTVLLKAESVHRKDARVAGHRGLPFGQHLGDTIPQHAPPAEAEVERMRTTSARMSRGRSMTMAP